MLSLSMKIGIATAAMAAVAPLALASEADGLVRWTRQRVLAEACTIASVIVPAEEFAVADFGDGAHAPCERGDFVTWSFSANAIELELVASEVYSYPAAFVDIRFSIPESCVATVVAEGIDGYWSGPVVPTQPVVPFQTTKATLEPGTHRFEGVLFQGSIRIELSGAGCAPIVGFPLLTAHVESFPSDPPTCVDAYDDEGDRSDPAGLAAGTVAVAIGSAEINEACFLVTQIGEADLLTTIDGPAFSLATEATCGQAARGEYEFRFSIDRPHLVYWTSSGAYLDRPRIRDLASPAAFDLNWRNELLAPPILVPAGEYRIVNADGWIRDCSFSQAQAFFARAAPADVVVDGKVNALDLVGVLGRWGVVEGPAIPEDVDFDGVVGTTDLARVLSDWGTTGSRNE